MRKNNLKGQRFGRLVVIADVGRTPEGRIAWFCKCDCGNYVVTDSKNLKDDKTKSCGCWNSDRMRKRNMELRGKESPRYKHGDTQNGQTTRLYGIWAGMIQRCKNPNNKYYGGRKIKVCPEWRDYILFRRWAFANGYQRDLTIDRINNNGDYEPSNCQWITRKENARKAAVLRWGKR